MTELNLLPPYLKEKDYKRQKTRNYILIGLIGITILFLLIFLPLSTLYRARYEETVWRKRAEEANNASIKMENEKIRREIEFYMQYIGDVEQLTKNKIFASNRIRELEKYIPVDVVFDSLAYGENSITINGTATSLDSISRLTSSIQTGGTYGKVRISSIIAENSTRGGSTAQNMKVYRCTINAVEGDERQ